MRKRAVKYRVKIRRNIALVKPNAKQVDGKVYNFERGWLIDDLPLYLGEWAMITRDKDYPLTAPAWIASGDLEKL